MVAITDDGYWVPWGQPAEHIRNVRVRRFDVNLVEMPAWALPAGTGSVRDFATTPDGGLFVQASGGAGIQRLIRFDALGTILWTQDGLGSPTTTEDRRPTELTMDQRGNAFAIAQINIPGVGVQQVLTKWIGGGPVGTSYCGPAVPNSTGGPAIAEALGTTSISDNNVSIIGSGLPTSSSILWLASTTQAVVVGPGASQGNLCLGGAVGRFLANGQVSPSDASGRSSLQVELFRLPQPNGLVSAAAGQSWNFQAWFRDSGPTGSVSNFTDAISITLQ